MLRDRCLILENKKVAPGHYVLKMRAPGIARAARPGQFAQIICADSFDPLLPRPFSFLTADKKDISVLYQVVGKGTHLLSRIKKGETLGVIGPLGNGFGPGSSAEISILVGGGVGIPPLLHLAQQRVKKNKASRKGIHVFLGARHKSLLLCQKDFKRLGVTLHLATDDGSKGKKGFVTVLLEEFLKDTDTRLAKIYTCGPTPMLRAVSALASKFDVSCEVSVEVPMACGFGACLGCAIKVRGTGQDHRFAIACCEGPVFEGSNILWE